MFKYDTKNRQKTQEITERQEVGFPKEKVENTDLYKPILNKIMAIHEQCVKYNLGASLMS